MRTLLEAPQLLIKDLEVISGKVVDFIFELKNRRVLITGGTGFIGTCLLQTLLHLNEIYNLNLKIVVVSRKNTHYILDKEFHITSEHIEFIKSDIRALNLNDNKIDYIFHCAGSPNRSLISNYPLEMFETLANGTYRVLEFAKTNNVLNTVVLSSSHVYGKRNGFIEVVNEQSLGYSPCFGELDSYMIGKQVSEFYCSVFNKKDKLNVTTVRCFNQIGPFIPLNTSNFIGDLVLSVIQSKEIKIEGDTSLVRSYMYVTDLMVWLLKMLIHGKNNLYNVGSDVGLSIGEIAEWVAKTYQLELIYVQEKSNNSNWGVIPDIQLARSLGLSITTDFYEGFSKTVKWYQTVLGNPDATHLSQQHLS